MPPPYTELNVLSAFSLLEGATLPEDLAAEAARLGHERLALTDRNSVSGVVRFNVACKSQGIKPIIGAELTIGTPSGDDAGRQCPITPGSRLVLLARNGMGWKNLCKLLTIGRTHAPKGDSAVPPEDLETHREGLACLTGPLYRGALSGVLGDVLGWTPTQTPSGRYEDRTGAAAHVLGWLRDVYGEHLGAEVVRHGLRGEALAESMLRRASALAGVPLVAAGDVHYATAGERRLQDVLTCIRLHTTLDAAGRRLFPNDRRHLFSPEAMASRFSDLPEAVQRTEAIAAACDYTLDDLDYRFPSFPLPEGERDLNAFLRRVVMDGARSRYDSTGGEVERRIERELSVITSQDLAGYFLVVWDIVRFCREKGILCQGRGSSVGSVVCHCLGISSLDPIAMDLLFERFLSEARRETPDIDLDIEHERREEVIQYVYQRYGRERAAMVCEVISYRRRSAIRDVGKVLGFDEGEISQTAKALERVDSKELLAGNPPKVRRPELLPLLLDLAGQIQGLPRHLSIHVGGMVVSKTDIDTVVPVEKAAMPGRTVIQWDKDDCAELGIVKIDLLGLGMLTMLRMGLEALNEHLGMDLSLSDIPPNDPKVYDLLCEADTLGVFQVESRAQMNTLPRVKPRCFYDLVVEVALIRPGPIQGEMVHPYLRRRRGEEEVTYLHPSLEPVLRRTLGVPLFQEQGMRVAIAAAGFTAAQADALRKAMGFRRATTVNEGPEGEGEGDEAQADKSSKAEAPSNEGSPHMIDMTSLRKQLVDGMTRNGIEPDVQERIISQITAFSSYGFPESHAAAFAGLVYASAWLKTHYPSIFYLALLNAQPMGFYSPSSIVNDAARHNVPVLPINVNASCFDCTLEPLPRDDAHEVNSRDRPALTSSPSHAVRLGLRFVQGIGEGHRDILEREKRRGDYCSLADFARRTGLGPRVLGRLAAADAFGCLGLSRREALWEAAASKRSNGDLFERSNSGRPRPDAPEVEESSLQDGRGAKRPEPDEDIRFPEMTAIETLAADHAATGLSLGPHPMELLRRAGLTRGALNAKALREVPGGRLVRVAGQVIVRQRPGSAKGMVFMTLEDETGMTNLAIQPHIYERFRGLIREVPFLIVEGRLRREEKLISVNARRFQRIEPPRQGRNIVTRSHDFH